MMSMVTVEGSSSKISGIAISNYSFLLFTSKNKSSMLYSNYGLILTEIPGPSLGASIMCKSRTSLGLKLNTNCSDQVTSTYVYTWVKSEVSVTLRTPFESISVISSRVSIYFILQRGSLMKKYFEMSTEPPDVENWYNVSSIVFCKSTV